MKNFEMWCWWRMEKIKWSEKVTYEEVDKSQVTRVSRSNESLQIKVNNRELKEVDHFWKCINKRWLLHKGNQDENCHCQRSI